ncbi:DUF2868 domain-containing protein [Luteolibacter flavescens]|uniref:DUF2868 domain-containing protein n=1 Tax=Luteolibacter flavescens TaxID=1859460 RepID=A0ABT3FJ26_9BACT|nr:DUF2868 domain-containing protein [Luteolibacter flavescens]MCW1883281.1 DUF2868 domain-containing protein [Luteolibacter flavescens]
MRGAGGRWKWDELIDFEVALAAWDGESRPDEVASEGSRPAVMKSWKLAAGVPEVGRTWVRAIAWAGAIASGLAFLAGVGAAWGCYDRDREGVDVIILLVFTLLIPWLTLVVGLTVWIFRPRWGGLIGPVLRKLVAKFAGKDGGKVLSVIEGSPELAKSFGWKLAARAQSAALNFHLGAIIGLTLLFVFRRVGFYWETTTERAMERTLESVVQFLSMPWRDVLPRMVPEIATSRRGADWEGGGASWMAFLILALLVWGVAPRFLLEAFAHTRSWLAVRTPAFQSPRHRRLWRVLTGVKRGEEPAGPADGALVLDLGGISPDRDSLRPFFLRHLRLNPVAWETLEVLDEGREAAARTALGKAPAGIIVLAEGWSLAPRQMEETLKRVLAAAGGRRSSVVVADFDREGRPRPPKADDRAAWEAYFDGQKGLDVEVSFYEEDRTWAPG